MIDKISESYADVNEGEKLALFNSASYLEIAINKGNAAGLFGLQGYSEKSVSQAQFLTGIASRWLEQKGSSAEFNTRQFQTLTHPDHLGQRFRVLVQSRG